ncbi:hypothetical protein NPIL_473131, partial [Nephila pilipes]
MDSKVFNDVHVSDKQ